MASTGTAAMEQWLVDRVEGMVAPLEVRVLAAGRSNTTAVVSDAAGRRVITRSPGGDPVRGAAVLRRERFILDALAATPIPVPRVIALCEDRDAGGPFLVQAFVAGTVLDSPAHGRSTTAEMRRTSAFDLIDTLAALHSLDITGLGLAELAPPTPFLQRQLRTWSRVWAQTARREAPQVDALERALRELTPRVDGTTLVHGDFRLGNCILGVDGRLLAILDWELATVGAPLADVGYLRAWWQDGVLYDPTAAGGFPPFEALLDRYVAATGADIQDLDFFVAFSWWRLAVINETVLARAARGEVADAAADVATLAAATIERAERGLAVLGRAGRVLDATMEPMPIGSGSRPTGAEI